MNNNIFKANDIRGIYPKEINEKNVLAIAEAFIVFLKKRSGKKILKIALSRDNRPSSQNLYKAIKKELAISGINLFCLGKTPTPAFYFFCWKNKMDGGIQTTASHNPIRFNGLKLIGEKAEIIGIQNGLKEIEAITRQANKNISGKKRKIIIYKKAVGEYVKFCLKKTKPINAKMIKIIADSGNSVPALAVKEIKKRSRLKIVSIFSQLNKPPTRSLDPFTKGATKELSRKVIKEKANFGVIFDGDGDRIIFVDDKGKTINGGTISSILMEEMAREKVKKKKKIVVSMSSSWIIKEIAKKTGFKAVFWKTGHSYIKRKMKEEGAILGSEVSGHYFFKKTNYLESPLIALILVTNRVAREKKPLSEIRKKYEKYSYSGQVNLRAQNKGKIISLIEKEYSKKKPLRKIKIDGIRIEFSDWWFVLRQSKTESLIRLTIEAKSKEIMRQKLKEIKKKIADFKKKN